MERELVELFEAAKKAAEAAAGESGGPADETRCLDALERLKDFPVNLQILKSTQVGKRLRHLTKHPRTKIQTLATDLIELWKKIILDQTHLNKNGVSATADSSKKPIPVKVNKPDQLFLKKDKPVAPKLASNSTTNSNAPVKLESTSSPKPVKPETTSSLVKQEKPGSSMRKLAPHAPPKLTSMLKCNDSVRDKLRENLVNALSKVPQEAYLDIKDQVDACDPIRVAVSVESVLFEKWGSFNGAQKVKYRSLLFNLKDDNNPDFRRRVLLGEIKPQTIVNMTAIEMASDQRQSENKQIEEKKLFDCERGGAPKATTDQFRCGRCGQRKCTYYQLQTRSADEPMTTFVTCVNCNNHWKFC